MIRNNIALLVVMLILSGCKKENMCDCIKRTGSIITETRELDGFDKIYVENNVNVFITQDSAFSVKVEAGKNIVPLIKTEVVGGILYCRNKNRCNWTRSYDKPLNIYVTMPVVRYITSDGTGNIKSLNTISTPEFEVRTMNSGDVELSINNSKLTSRMHGSSDLTLLGHTNEHLCDIGGTGYLNADGLQTDYTFLHTFTLGLCYVRVSDLLVCKIDYHGDVHCSGNPADVQNSENSTGRLFLE